MGGLTLRGSIQLVFEGSEHLQGEGLALLPDINELLDFLLHEKRRVSGNSIRPRKFRRGGEMF